MEKLFDDSLLFQKERPKKITKKQEEEFYIDLAKECIEEGFSSDDEETIAEDFEGLYDSDSGFEKAKHLEERGCADYVYSGDFISFLENIVFKRDEILEENVKLWVKAHNPRPKIEIVSELMIKSSLGFTKELKEGGIIFVIRYNIEQANYIVHPNPKHNGGYVIPFEKIESNCEILNK